MSERDTSIAVAAGQRELAQVTGANPLVLRGLADLDRVAASIQLPVPPQLSIKLELTIPGKLYIYPHSSETHGVLLAETPATVELTPTTLAELRVRKLSSMRARLVKFRELNAPEVIIQHGMQMLKKLEEATWAQPGQRLEDYRFSFDGDERITDVFADELVRTHGLIRFQHLSIDLSRETPVAFLTQLHGLEALDLKLSWRKTPDDDLAQIARLTCVTRLECELGPTLTDQGLGHLRNRSCLHKLEVRLAPEVTDEGLGHLAVHTELKELVLRGCQVTGRGLRHLGALNALELLELSGSVYGGSAVTDEGLAYLHLFPNLRTLSLEEGPKVTDASLIHIAGLTNLHTLYLSRCSVTDKGLARLSVLTALRDLDISGCPVTDDGLAYLRNLSKLRELRLAQSEYQHPLVGKRAGITDEGLKQLADLTDLEELGLFQCQVTGKGLSHLRRMSNLRCLDLSGCKSVTDEGLVHLSSLTQLTHLYLTGCSLTDSGLIHLRKLSRLQVLNLDECDAITDQGLQSLSLLTELRYLVLHESDGITAHGISLLKRALTHCEIE
jgi:hypothetical protein